MTIRETDLPTATSIARVRGLGASGESVNILVQVLADLFGPIIHVSKDDGSLVLLEDYLSEIMQAAATGSVGYATKALMVAAVPTVPPTGTMREVTNDPADVSGSVNGVWRYDPAAPGDHWVKAADQLTVLKAQVSALDAELTGVENQVTPLVGQVVITASEVIDGLTMILRFASSTGRSLGGFSADSFLNIFKGIRIGTSTVRNQILPETDPDILLNVQTRNGRVKMRLSASGTKDINPFAASAGQANPLGADVLFMPHYGQSLGEGAESVQTLSLVPTGHRGRMFTRSVRTFRLDAFANNPVGRPASDFVVIDLHEATDGGVGETIATAMVAALRDQLVGPNSGASRNSGPEIICGFAGRGGRRLHHLDKAHQNDPAGRYYDTLIDDVRRAKAYADANGKTFAVLGLMYMQGEADGDKRLDDGDTPMAYEDFIPAWAAGLTQLADDFDADARAISGQAGRIPLFIYQTSGTITGQAQMYAADQAPAKIIPVGPTYFVPSGRCSSYLSGGVTVHGNEIHLSPEGQRWYGSIVGKNIYRHLVGREENVALRPLLARKVSTDEIDVTFRVPRPPIRLDATLLPAMNYPGWMLGFGCTTGGGDSQVNGPAVTSATVIASDTIRFKLASAVPAGAKMGYGRLRGAQILSQLVADWRDGATLPNGRPSKELAFTGDIRSEIQTYVNEGAFYVINQTSGLGVGRTWVGRSLSFTGGQTVITGENVATEFGSGVTPATAFVAGQTVALSRVQPYGNCCDSDPALSPLKFVDTTYGVGRLGSNYPMANFLVAFQDLEVIGA